MKPRPNIKKIFIPETKISDSQVTISRTDWPKSGWIIRKKTINDKIKNEAKCEKFKFLNLFELIILAITKIKKGFINSIGWKLKKYKFNHLFAPFTSTPINGTIANKIKEIKKPGSIVLFMNSLFNDEIKIIRQKDISVYRRCFWKNE